jgi:sirohydrochlorin ferrochelatase
MKKNNYVAFILCSLVLLCSFATRTTAQTPEIKIGIIGTDTSHVTAFTKLLNDKNDPNHVPGARVVAAFKGGSPDVEASSTRVDRFAAELKEKWGVEFVDSIEELVPERWTPCCWRAWTGGLT